MTAETVQDRTSQFMHALAANVDAVNISGDETGVGYMVHAWIKDNSEERETARELAQDHGFTEYGPVTTVGMGGRPPSAEERERIRFETEGE